MRLSVSLARLSGFGALRAVRRRNQPGKHVDDFLVAQLMKILVEFADAAKIVLDAFTDLKMSYPKMTHARRRELQAIRKRLEK